MISIFGIEVSGETVVFILLANTVLLIVAVIGFTNLKLQIRDLKAMLNQIKEKQNNLPK